MTSSKCTVSVMFASQPRMTGYWLNMKNGDTQQ